MGGGQWVVVGGLTCDGVSIKPSARPMRPKAAMVTGKSLSRNMAATPTERMRSPTAIK